MADSNVFHEVKRISSIPFDNEGAFGGFAAPTQTSAEFSIPKGFGPVVTNTATPLGGFGSGSLSTSSDDGIPDMNPSTSADIGFSLPTQTATTAEYLSSAPTTPLPSFGATSTEGMTDSSLTTPTPTADPSASTIPADVPTTGGAFQGNASSPTAVPAAVSSPSSSKGWIAAAVIVPVFIVSLIVVGVILFLRRRRRQQHAATTHHNHGTTPSVSTAGMLHTGRTSRSGSDPEKNTTEKYNGNSALPYITQPASSVQHNYATGLDISSVASTTQDRTATDRSTPSDALSSPPPPYVQTNTNSNSRAPSSVGPSPMSMTGSNPFTERTNDSSNVSFSGFSAAGLEYNSSSNPSRGHDAPSPAISPVLELEAEHDDGDDNDDAISSISEAEIQNGSVAQVGRAHRASVIDLNTHVLPESRRSS